MKNNFAQKNDKLSNYIFHEKSKIIFMTVLL